MPTKLTITLDQPTADYLEPFDDGNPQGGALAQDNRTEENRPDRTGRTYSVDILAASPHLIKAMRDKGVFKNTDTFVNPLESWLTGRSAVLHAWADPWTQGTWGDTYEHFDSLSEILTYASGVNAAKAGASAVMAEIQVANDAKGGYSVANPIYDAAFIGDMAASAGGVIAGAVGSMMGTGVYLGLLGVEFAAGSFGLGPLPRQQENESHEDYLRRIWPAMQGQFGYDDAAGLAHFADSVMTVVDEGQWAAAKTVFESLFVFNGENEFKHFGPWVIYGAMDVWNADNDEMRLKILDWYRADYTARWWGRFPGMDERWDTLRTGILGYDPDNPNRGDRWAAATGTTGLIVGLPTAKAIRGVRAPRKASVEAMEPGRRAPEPPTEPPASPAPEVDTEPVLELGPELQVVSPPTPPPTPPQAPPKSTPVIAGISPSVDATVAPEPAPPVRKSPPPTPAPQAVPAKPTGVPATPPLVKPMEVPESTIGRPAPPVTVETVAQGVLDEAKQVLRNSVDAESVIEARAIQIANAKADVDTAAILQDAESVVRQAVEKGDAVLRRVESLEGREKKGPVFDEIGLVSGIIREQTRVLEEQLGTLRKLKESRNLQEVARLSEVIGDQAGAEEYLGEAERLLLEGTPQPPPPPPPPKPAPPKPPLAEVHLADGATIARGKKAVRFEPGIEDNRAPKPATPAGTAPAQAKPPPWPEAVTVQDESRPTGLDLPPDEPTAKVSSRTDARAEPTFEFDPVAEGFFQDGEEGRGSVSLEPPAPVPTPPSLSPPAAPAETPRRPARKKAPPEDEEVFVGEDPDAEGLEAVSPRTWGVDGQEIFVKKGDRLFPVTRRGTQFLVDGEPLTENTYARNADGSVRLGYFIKGKFYKMSEVEIEKGFLNGREYSWFVSNGRVIAKSPKADASVIESCPPFPETINRFDGVYRVDQETGYLSLESTLAAASTIAARPVVRVEAVSPAETKPAADPPSTVQTVILDGLEIEVNEKGKPVQLLNTLPDTCPDYFTFTDGMMYDVDRNTGKVIDPDAPTVSYENRLAPLSTGGGRIVPGGHGRLRKVQIVKDGSVLREYDWNRKGGPKNPRSIREDATSLEGYLKGVWSLELELRWGDKTILVRFTEREISGKYYLTVDDIGSLPPWAREALSSSKFRILHFFMESIDAGSPEPPVLFERPKNEETMRWTKVSSP